jgi:hypothetical protein
MLERTMGSMRMTLTQMRYLGTSLWDGACHNQAIWPVWNISFQDWRDACPSWTAKLWWLNHTNACAAVACFTASIAQLPAVI